MEETSGRRFRPAALLRWLTPAILGLGLAGAAFAVASWAQETRAKVEETGLLARGAAIEMDRFLQSQLASMTAIAAADAVVQEDITAMSAYFDRIDPASIGFDGEVFWVARDGFMRARSEYDGEPLDFSDREWVQRVLATDRPWVSDARVGQLNAGPIVVFAVPTHDAQGNPTGVLGGAMRLDRTRIAAYSLESAAGTKVSIVDRVGQIVAGKEPVREVATVAPGFDYETLREAGAGTLQGATGPAGEDDRLVGYAAVPTGQWLLIVDQPQDEALGDARATLLVQLGLIAAITVLALAAAIWASRRVGSALVRQERALAAEQEAKLRLEELVGQLREREELREAFVGVLSHELRTPATTIYGMTAILARSPDRPDRDAIIEDIRDEADRLNRIIEDLLVLSRAERKVLSVGAEPVLVQRLVASVAADLSRRFSGVELAIDVPASLAPVAAEEGALRQVLYNLLSNAAKYGAGSEVRLEGREGKGRVQLRVSDGGPGFPAEDAERLFDLYYRSPPTSRKAAGTGIGLFVVRQLVEAMGGSVAASPGTDGGAVFTVTLAAYGGRGEDEDESAVLLGDPSADWADGAQPGSTPHAPASPAG